MLNWLKRLFTGPEELKPIMLMPDGSAVMGVTLGWDFQPTVCYRDQKRGSYILPGTVHRIFWKHWDETGWPLMPDGSRMPIKYGNGKD